MSKWVTAKDVAEHAGCARSTAAHVLGSRGDELGISKKMQARVMASANELGYRPNASARAIKRGKFDAIALLLKPHQHFLPSAQIQGVMAGARNAGQRVQITEVETDYFHDDSAAPELMKDLSVDGLLINHSPYDVKTTFNQLNKLHIPAVVLNIKHHHDAAYPDEQQGAYDFTRALHEQGIKDIAFFGIRNKQFSHYSHKDRARGYEDAMDDLGLMQNLHTYFIEDGKGQTPTESRLDMANQVLESNPAPKTIICSSTESLGAMIPAILAIDLTIGSDIHLAVFHYERIRDWSWPIHTLVTPHRECAQAGVTLLMNKIREKGASSCESAIINYPDYDFEKHPLTGNNA